ncbi:twin-arginine translocase TatA/TatE family subunit, partial [Arthrobacter sp. H5]|uniref:twin-arginine translocase TatA/TatE family subunit n=1 Tax=Arthrobacter sp. H5 TaxID=1267973 RepID=UPI000569BBA6
MLGINGYEFVLLAILAVVILGPERLPEYAAQLGRLVKGLRRMATGAREQLREEVGSEFDDVDWQKLDPRQYDPRRIIKEALLDDIEDAIKPLSEGAPKPVA